MSPGRNPPAGGLYGPADLANPMRARTALFGAIEDAKHLLCDLAQDNTPSNHRQYPPLKDRFPQFYKAFAAVEMLWRAADLPDRVPAFSHKGLSLPEESFDVRLMYIYERAEDEYQLAGPPPHPPALEAQISELRGPAGGQPKTDAAWNHLDALARFAQEEINKRDAKNPPAGGLRGLGSRDLPAAGGP